MAEQDPRTPILLLKTRSTPHDGYDDFFTSQNYNPAFIPVLEHHFHTTNLQRIHDLLVSGGFRAGHPNQKYGGIIFTSQRAVEGFAHVLEGVDDVTPLTLPLYTVGPATHRSLSALTTTYLPNATLHGQDTGTGELLAQFILSHYPTYPYPDTTGNPDGSTTTADPQTPNPTPTIKPLLFLVGEQRRDIIPKTLMDPARRPDARIPVEELVVYETGVMAGFEEAFGARIRAERDAFQRNQHQQHQQHQQQEDDEKVVWTVVFSPTGCEAMVRVLETVDASSSSSSSAALGGGLGLRGEDGDLGHKDNGRRFFVATIGPTTRDYLRNRVGFEPDVCAEKPSPEGVGRGIQKFMEEYRAGRK